MRFLQLYRSRKYLLRITASLLLLTLLFLMISSVAQYYNSERTVLAVQDEANRKVLDQTAYNIEYINELVKYLQMSLFFDLDMVSLLHTKSGLEVFDLTNKLDRLQKVASSFPFLESIMAFNAYSGCYYSSLRNFGVSCDGDALGGYMDRFLRKGMTLPRLSLIPIYFNTPEKPGKNVQIFSSFMYDAPDDTYRGQSVLIINVKPEWILNHINNVNRLTENIGSSIFIMDSEDRVLLSNEYESAREYEISLSVRQHLDRTGAQAGYFKTGSGSDKKIINYVRSKSNDWIIVSVYDYDSVLGKVARMRTISILLVVIFAVFSVIVSILLSFGLYRPIRNIVHEFGGSNAQQAVNMPPGRDEFSFISSTYSQANDHIRLLREQQQAGKDLLQTLYLRKLILESSTIPKNEWRNQLDQSRTDLCLNQPVLLVVLKIDNYDAFLTLSSDVQNLLKFAISNITKEFVSSRFRCDIADMRNDHLVLLLNSDPPDSDVGETAADLLREAQRRLSAYYHISFTATVSEPVPHCGMLDKIYWQTLEFAKYRLIAGKSAIIFPAMVRQNIDNIEFEFPPEAERLLSEGLMANNFEQVDNQLGQLFRYLATLNYDNMTYLIFHLFSIVNKVLQTINKNNVSQVAIDTVPFYKAILGHETLDEIHATFIVLFREINEKRGRLAHESVNPILVDTIKDIVGARYRDMNLSLQSIAAVVQMSTSYVGKIFRKHESMSVAEYITEFRLNKSLELLDSTPHNINEIAEMVGFGNKSYFYKLFKAKYGATPNDYRIKKTISGI